MERKWVIAVVGDIRGFGSWTRRSSVTVEIQEPFIKTFYEGLESYVKTHLDSTLKYTGDGFQIVKEFSQAERKNGKCFEFITGLQGILKSSLKSVSDCADPIPEGFRLRIFSGFVFKLMVLDPNDPERKRVIPEHVGYTLNTAHRILNVNPEILCLCDGKISIVKNKRFKSKPLENPSLYPNGVDKEDIDGLKIITI